MFAGDQNNVSRQLSIITGISTFMAGCLSRLNFEGDELLGYLATLSMSLYILAGLSSAIMNIWLTKIKPNKLVSSGYILIGLLVLATILFTGSTILIVVNQLPNSVFHHWLIYGFSGSWIFFILWWRWILQ